jgi:hypothetical protein
MSWQHQFHSKFLIKPKEKSMTNENSYIWLDLPKDEQGNESWTYLDTVVRKWATLTGFEKDQNQYQKMKELYQ